MLVGQDGRSILLHALAYRILLLIDRDSAHVYHEDAGVNNDMGQGEVNG